MTFNTISAKHCPETTALPKSILDMPERDLILLALMKTLPFIIILVLLAAISLLQAEQAHLTKSKVKQIAALVAKKLEPTDPIFDAKSGTWHCYAGPQGPGVGLVIVIRDKDGYYKRMYPNKVDNYYMMERSLKRRIDKIIKSNGEQIVAHQGILNE